jgi:TatD DNase family protein
MFVDSHCHLNHEREGLGSPDEIIARAKAANVSHMLTICCEIAKEKDTLIDIASRHANVWATIGTHPHEAALDEEKAYTTQDIINLTNHPKVIGIGESGLDYHYMHSPKDEQITSFRKHLQACIKTDLPIIVHSRNAEADTMRIIREEGQGTRLKGLLHCFSSKRELAMEAVEFGFSQVS